MLSSVQDSPDFSERLQPLFIGQMFEQVFAKTTLGESSSLVDRSVQFPMCSLTHVPGIFINYAEYIDCIYIIINGILFSNIVIPTPEIEHP